MPETIDQTADQTNESVSQSQRDLIDQLLKPEVQESLTVLVVKDTAKEIAATAIEAKDRADESNEVIGLFGLLKMLKDPQAQKLFRFVQSYLQIMSEREKQK